MAAPSSLIVRSVLAILLAVGFYTLALGVAGALILGIVADTSSGRIHIRFLLLAGIGAGTILWSILPRRDNFTAPGPRLLPQDHVRLFELISSVARKTEQAEPSEVYLVPDVNAFVSERGGVMGFGSRRIMGIGLPTLQALSVSQLEGVLAHEFGHYHGGDTQIGPWIYKVRSTLVRTVGNLDSAGSLLRFPFRWYAKLFLRITLAISRWQEYAADRLAAGIVGKTTVTQGLVQIHRAAAAYSHYWQNEVLPVLQGGHRPPIAEGFSMFLDVPDISDKVDQMIEQEMEQAVSDPYDTHPCLHDRVTALESLPEVDPEVNNHPAIALIDNPDALEVALLIAMNSETASELVQMSWEDFGTTQLIPEWKELTSRFAQTLEPYGPESLPRAVSNIEAIGQALQQEGAPARSQEELQRFAQNLLVVTFSLQLVEQGWLVKTSPGLPVSLRQGGRTLYPFHLINDLTEGEMSDNEWMAFLRKNEITA